MILHKNDIITLKSLNIPGFICQRGFECLFQRMDGIYYLCNTYELKIQEHQILKIVDSFTGETIYQHKAEDAL